MPTPTTRPTRVARAVGLLVGASALVLLAAACGDDEGADDEAFCAAVDELSQAQDPSIDLLDAYRATAPAELDDEVDLAFGAYEEALETGDFDALGSPEVLAATDAMQEVEAEICGPPADGG